ncbi:hypothetical protein MSWAN_1083 [Methanobacterium paludis]|uniref:Uncharacterized protein n=2 Tax=Methanobacterium paludis (strain DSM 25820 / JCM 18151 / SWAN1) TaxID=868131 RepID=F6D4A5_METPW|nr:hypothetical protein MSWAN_1083 [Methanobacterium paludis]
MALLCGDMQKMVVENAIKIIKSLKGVVDVQELSDEDRKTLLKIESSRKDDVVPVVNEGLDECLKKEFCLVMLKTEEFRNPSKPTVLLVTDKGRILGQELISPEDKKKYADRNDVYFLSNNFIVFKPDTMTRSVGVEKELFLLPSIPFPELNEIKEISNVVSGSPSTMGDAYIKNRCNYPDDPHLATILVAFSTKNEE